MNWNSGSQLKTCLASLGSATDSLDGEWELLVVDNASGDDSITDILAPKVSLRIIRNDRNLGFARACNQGANEACGRYLLFLNPDTRLFADSLVKPLSFMEDSKHKAVGICGIRLLDSAGETSTCASRFPALRVMIGTFLGASAWFPRVFPTQLMSPCELEASQCVDQVTGAYFFVRRHVYEACGGFDERFFVYYEEVDFSLRALRKGFKSYYLAEVTAFHRGGGCSEQVKATRLFYSLRSRIQYVRKHFSFVSKVCMIWVMLLELVARILRASMRASWAEVRDTVFAYVLLFRHFLKRW